MYALLKGRWICSPRSIQFCHCMNFVLFTKLKKKIKLVRKKSLKKRKMKRTNCKKLKI